MVRVWSWELSEHLDDSRLPAAHAEVHYILNALARGSGMWWLHPETQAWYGREPQLRHIHDALADLMTARGMKHSSQIPGPRAEPPPTQADQLLTDRADLARKWEKEGRISTAKSTILDNGLQKVIHLHLGVPVTSPRPGAQEPVGALKSGAPVFYFRPAREPRPPLHLRLSEADKCLLAASVSFPRYWTKESAAATKAQAMNRGPTTDLKPDELRLHLPLSWSEGEVESLLRRVSEALERA